MRCSYCNKIMRRSETAHAVRFGTVDVVRETFIPAKDCADVVMCQSCGELLMKMVYIRLERKTLG
jgi:phage FluMu protein Com